MCPKCEMPFSKEDLAAIVRRKPGAKTCRGCTVWQNVVEPSTDTLAVPTVLDAMNVEVDGLLRKLNSVLIGVAISLGILKLNFLHLGYLKRANIQLLLIMSSHLSLRLAHHPKIPPNLSSEAAPS